MGNDPVSRWHHRGLEPARYLDRALMLMRKHAVARDKVDWESLLIQARALAEYARTPADTYPAIIAAVEALRSHDAHSFFSSPAMSRSHDRQISPAQSGLIALFPECVVADVTPGGPAERAGVRCGDMVLAVDGQAPQPASHNSRLVRLVEEPGSPVESVRRQDGASSQQTISVRLTLQRSPTSKAADAGCVLRCTLTPAPMNLARPPAGRRLALPERAGNLGYLDLPAVTGRGRRDYTRAARALVDALGRAGPELFRGWIVDLRRNTGGDMWAPLAGIGPVLGAGVAGAFVNARGRTIKRWSYRSSVAWLGWQPMASAGWAARRPRRGGKPVAVLTGPLTASAGEALAVSFRGRPATRSFGEPTYGLPSGNETFRLPDGARLTVTAAREADRTGRVYDGSIVPDERVAIDWALVGNESDPVLDAAISWLTSSSE